jgi:hypothetical protein
MKLTTQLDLGQKVWDIENKSSFSWEQCPTCEGTYKVRIKGKEYKCPNQDCFNGRIKEQSDPQWKIAGTLTIGLIRCEVRDSPGMETELNASNYQPQKGRQEEYMCVETGIGSGSIHKLGKHIFASEEEAQAECDRLNSESKQ